MQEDKSTILSVEKAAKLLLLFSVPRVDELSIQEISEKLGVPKTTAHRMATTLVKTRLLEQNERNHKYTLGIASGIIGRRYLASHNLEKSALRHIRRLVAACNESVSFNVREGVMSVVLEKIDSGHSVRVVAPVGTRTPLHCSGSGKCFLAFAPEEKRARLLAQLQPLAAKTPKTITDIARLRQEIAQVRRWGFSIECEEIHMGMFTLAAPVRDASGEVIGALTLSGPKDRLLGSIDPYEVAEEVWRARVKPQLDSLLAQCAAFSRELGWQGEQEDI